MSITLKQLVKTATEMSKILTLNPVIPDDFADESLEDLKDIALGHDDLEEFVADDKLDDFDDAEELAIAMYKELITKASELIEPGDELTPATEKLLDELKEGKEKPEPKKEKKVEKEVTPVVDKKAKGKKVVVESEPEEEPEEDAVDVNDDTEALIADVEDAEKMADLKEIIEDNADVFARFSPKVLTTYKKANDLRASMLDVLQKPKKDEVVVKPAKEAKKVEKVVEEATVAKADKKAKGKKAVEVVEEEEVVQKPAKKAVEKKVLKEINKPEKKVKEKGAMYFVRRWTVEDPEISVADLMKKLEAKGFEANKSSVTIRRMEMLVAMDLLEEMGKLK
jgi:hypothetical protein